MIVQKQIYKLNLSRCLQYNIIKALFIRKNMHYIKCIPPTKARDNRYYKFRPKFCGQCQGQLENEDHIIICHSTQLAKIRGEYLKEVEAYLLQDHTPILVKHAIYDNMEQRPEPSTITTNSICYTPNITKAIKIQTDLGWNNFIRGRISIEWGYIINEHKTNSEEKDFKAETWGANLLHINWIYILKLGAVRCEAVHGINSNEANIIIKERMLEEIRHIQTFNRELLLRDIEWLHEDMQNTDKYDNKALETTEQK